MNQDLYGGHTKNLREIIKMRREEKRWCFPACMAGVLTMLHKVDGYGPYRLLEVMNEVNEYIHQKGCIGMEYKSVNGDEFYTLPEHASVLAESLNIPKGSAIWLPFNDRGREIEKAINAAGYKAICTDGDFFETEPPEGIVAVVSNPPFAEKKRICKRLQELNIPYALILPILWLSGGCAWDYGHQMIFWRRRVRFLLPGEKLGGPRAGCFVLSNGILKEDLIIINDMRRKNDEADSGRSD